MGGDQGCSEGSGPGRRCRRGLVRVGGVWSGSEASEASAKKGGEKVKSGQGGPGRVRGEDGEGGDGRLVEGTDGVRPEQGTEETSTQQPLAMSIADTPVVVKYVGLLEW